MRHDYIVETNERLTDTQRFVRRVIDKKRNEIARLELLDQMLGQIAATDGATIDQDAEEIEAGIGAAVRNLKRQDANGHTGRTAGAVS